MKTPFTALAPFFSQPTQAAPLGSIQSQIYQAFGLPAGTQFEKLQARLGDLLTTPNLHLTANTFQALSRVAFSEDISWGTLTTQDLGVLESFGRRIKSLSRPIEALAVVDTPLGAVEVPDLQQLSPKFGGFTPQSASVSLAGSTPARAVEKAKEVMELKSIPVPPGSPERKEIISQWLDRVAGEDATKKRPIQKILLACNGLAATRLVDGFNALSAEIAKDMMYNVADPLINMVAMAGPSDLESGASYLEKLSRETIEMVPENIQTEELDKNGKPISVRVFLHYETILACAKKYNVDAIAVGWGWVSEHAAFVQLAESRGFKVIAPPADAMEKLGGKIESKLLAESADVPVLPWTGGPVNTPADARKFAKENGYKVVIKATAGGGGRGIRIIKGISDPEIRYQDWDQPLETNEELLQTQYFDVSKSLKFLPNHYALQSFISSTVAEKRKKAKIIRLLKLLHQKSLQDQGEQSEEKERDRMAHLLRQAEDAVNTNDDEQLTGLAHELIRENHVVDLFFSAQNEGLNSFKDKTVFMELLAPDNARHIEVQVDADEYRGVRTLLERDCSLQLRRQKVSEEAPAIFVSQALRKAMREAAKRISLQAGYTNLGTCEFLCDGENSGLWR
ncbi:MAG: hypothetical protein IPJ69_00680 [Deltaproteobacteria bacterium]|nr:MAG: hypothetical protein IPJ69_00680 [Deltaproteobacteria bacterium]